MPQLLVQLSTVASSGPWIPVPDFAAVAEYRDAGTLRALAVDLGGFTASVDLDSGALTVGEERFNVAHPGAPLRPIYYKRMRHSTEGGTRLEFVALGWQATAERNIRFGVRLFPDERRWEIGETL